MHTTALGTLTVLPSDEAPDAFLGPLDRLMHPPDPAWLQNTPVFDQVQIC